MDRDQFNEELDRALPKRDKVPKWAQHVLGFVFIASITVFGSWLLFHMSICFMGWCLNGLVLAMSIVIVWLIVQLIKWLIKRRRRSQDEKK